MLLFPVYSEVGDAYRDGFCRIGAVRFQLYLTESGDAEFFFKPRRDRLFVVFFDALRAGEKKIFIFRDRFSLRKEHFPAQKRNEGRDEKDERDEFGHTADEG